MNCSSCICSTFDFSVCFAVNCADSEWVSKCVCVCVCRFPGVMGLLRAKVGQSAQRA